MSMMIQPGRFNAAAPPSGDSHRYLGIQCLTVLGGGSLYALAEVKMYEVSGGTNIALGATGVSASSYYNSDYVPINAFNGNLFGTTSVVPGLPWASATDGVQYIAKDFGSDKAIVEVKLWCRSDSNYATQSPASFDVIYSDDGVTWTVSKSYSGVAWVINGGSESDGLIFAAQ